MAGQGRRQPHHLFPSGPKRTPADSRADCRKDCRKCFKLVTSPGMSARLAGMNSLSRELRWRLYLRVGESEIWLFVHRMGGPLEARNEEGPFARDLGTKLIGAPMAEAEVRSLPPFFSVSESGALFSPKTPDPLSGMSLKFRPYTLLEL